MSDPDESLRQKLRSQMDLKGADSETDAETTDQEGDYEDDDDEDDDMEMGMSEDVEEAAQMIAEATDSNPEQVLEMLGPMLGEEDTKDHDAEMAGETEHESDGPDADQIVADAREAAADAAEEVVSEAVPDDYVTEDDLDAKLEDAVDALADETRDVIQKAETESTPTPAGQPDTSGVSKADLFSDTTEADE
jgi:hypothetical protein